MIDSLDVGTIVLSSLISGVIAITIAWFFRFKVKPKREIVFEDNRKDNVNRVCNILNFFDSSFERVYKGFEEEFQDLTKDMENIIPKPELRRENDEYVVELDFVDQMKKKETLKKLKSQYERTLETMEKQTKMFYDDISIFHNYLHNSFLIEIGNYMNATLHYSQELLNGQNYVGIGMMRLKHYKKIKSYLQNDKSIRENKGVKEFISRWEKQIEKDPVLKKYYEEAN